MPWQRMGFLQTSGVTEYTANIGPFTPGNTVGPAYIMWQLNYQQINTADILFWPQALVAVGLSYATYNSSSPPSGQTFDVLNDANNPAWWRWDIATFDETGIYTAIDSGVTTNWFEHASAPSNRQPWEILTKRKIAGNPDTQFGWLQFCVNTNPGFPDEFGFAAVVGASVFYEPTTT